MARRPDATFVNRFTYTYDLASRRTRVLAVDGSVTSYVYDPSGQLTREWRTVANTAFATITYDLAGNRTLLIDSGLRTTSTYDAANELVLDQALAGRTTYGYDLAGNRSQTTAPSTTTYYDWDVHNRLTQAVPVAGPVTMSYDGDGRRNRRQTPTQTRRYVYDFDKVLQDTDDTGVTQKQYASTEEQYGNLLSAYGGGQATYYAYDGLGSTDALLNPDGTSPDRYAYRAFGLESHLSGTDDNRATWVGQQGYYDDRESGLYFLKARYYDPASGKFISRDPKGFEAGDANLYRYVSNDPVNAIDPSGLEEKCGRLDYFCQGKQTLKQGVQYVGGKVEQGVQVVRDVGQKVGELGKDFVRGQINGFLRLAGIPEDKFWQLMSQFGDTATKLLRSAGEIARKLFDGTADGVKHFFENIAQHVKDGLYKWLFGSLEVNWDLIPAQWDNWTGWLAFFGDLVGLSWDKILSAVSEVFEPELGLILGLYQTVSDLVEKGWDGLIEWIKQKWEEIKEKFDFKKILLDTILEKGIKAVVRIAIEQAVKWALSLIPGAGIVTALEKIYQFRVWVYDNWERLKELANSVIEGIRVLLGDGGQERVAQLVEGGLADAFVPALDLIAKQFSLDVIPKTLRDIADEVIGFVPKQIKELLGKVKSYIGNWIKSLWGDLWGKREWVGGGEKHTLWVDLKAKKVMTTSSGTQKPVSEELKQLEGDLRGLPPEKQKLGKVLWGQSTQLVKGIEELYKASGRQTKARKPVKSKGKGKSRGKSGDVKTVDKRRKASGKLEGQLATKLKELQDLKGGGCGCTGKSCQTKQPMKKKAGCFVAGTLVSCRRGRFGIELVRLGWRVWTFLVEGRVVVEARRDPRDYRVIYLELDYADGSGVDVWLLRKVDWLEANAAVVGGVVRLDMPEMCAVGWARVCAIEASPELEEGPGGLVTGLFRHRAALVYDLHVSGEEKPLGVTPQHPIWSEDRQDWVAACELREGERLQAENGSRPAVESLVCRDRAEPVYNIEVDGDHCYRVGDQGLLVHNASAGWSRCDVCAKRKRKKYNDINTGGGAFQVDAEIAIDDTGKELTLGDIGGPGSDKIASSPVVCRVWKLYGLIKASPSGTPRKGYAQQASNALLVMGNPNSAINTSQYQAGHLVALEVGGPDDVRAVVPMFRSLNVGTWRSMEKWLLGCLKQRSIKLATIQVSLMYQGSGDRGFIPTQLDVKVEYEVAATGSPKISLRFYNRSETAKSGGRNFTGDPCLTSWSSLKPADPTPWSR
jgi:RHS repeat-associated protein